MSPYHAPDAAPIRDLAAALNIKTIALGLDPKSHSIALDAKRFGHPKGMSFVLPSLGDDSRESHAKWFEISGTKGVVVMTGSVNATAQSFDSTKNVEVALARLLSKRVVDWQKADPKELKYTPFPNYAHSTSFGIVDATLLPDGQLIGLVHSVKYAPGPIVVELLREGDCVFKLSDVALLESGQFRCSVEAQLTEADGAIQIRTDLVPGKRTPRGLQS